MSCSGGLINEDGAAYQALVLIEDELPLESAERILVWAESGLPVVFVNNAEQVVANDEVLKVNTTAASTTGSNNTSDEELASVISRIKAFENVRVVPDEAGALPALQELGVYPRASWAEPNTVLLPVLRSDTDADYLYLYHYMYEETGDFQTTVSVEGTFRPFFLDTWSGRVKAAENWRITEGRTEIDIDIAPGETQLLVLQKNAAPEEEAEASADYKVDIIPVSGWSLTVDSFEPGEKVTRTETNSDTGIVTTETAYATDHVLLSVGQSGTLAPWKDLDAVGESVSGIGTYTAVFGYDVSAYTENAEVIFRADSFSGGSAAVFLNGVPVPVNMDRRTADLSGLVKDGENTIEVRVTSSLRNRMREIGYDQGWNILHPEAADYGMTGRTWLTVRHPS